MLVISAVTRLLQIGVVQKTNAHSFFGQVVCQTRLPVLDTRSIAPSQEQR
ncbi:hypothetical protein [Desulfosporosinus hippei]|uniref:Uncharacterized protein n=1 Tax=Desulfosporosinus hippei DSM 8344 TaxID=1121419 RepID=A0A1G8AV70_9FIRM|nr:hypothetical protein [Desulfosporosinus hippei]SDH24713.1 hypothetical protein SAMN05443529_111127 [Desulfosporosinus hippei DSM 8344]